jgi:protease I
LHTYAFDPQTIQIPNMRSKTILMLVGPEYEDLELWYPKLRLEADGWRVPVAGLGEPKYTGKHGYPCSVDANVDEFKAADLAGIFTPGGWAPDKIRRNQHALKLLRDVDRAGGLIATICHGPWVLISAGIVKGRHLTSTVGIRDDVLNAGATWEDRAVVEDKNILSARVPKDLPEFGEALVGWLARKPTA